MRPERPDAVAAALRDPARAGRWGPADWDLLVRQARRADLLARIAALVAEQGGAVPAPVAAHLDAATLVCEAQHEEVRREVGHLERALATLDVPVVLLKGAAYVLAGLPAARGRTQSDVDILVPRDRLAEVEAALMRAGWATTHHGAYDQRYYREWMHELPPMRHVQRGTVLDVHHAILPLTARLAPPSAALLQHACPLPGHAGLRILAPADMALHAMSHLFHNEELSHGLRDLSDIDLLLRHFAATPGFWQQLLDRARVLDLERPLNDGLHYAAVLLGTPVPPAALGDAARTARRARPVQALMDALWQRTLRAPHPSTADALTPAARFALYVRAHWLRMPPALLCRHLTVKALGLGKEPAGMNR